MTFFVLSPLDRVAGLSNFLNLAASEVNGEIFIELAVGDEPGSKRGLEPFFPLGKKVKVAAHAHNSP